jgi:hypothetical protein
MSHLEIGSDKRISQQLREPMKFEDHCSAQFRVSAAGIPSGGNFAGGEFQQLDPNRRAMDQLGPVADTSR